MWNENDIKKLMINPFYCINIAEGLFGEHSPMVSKEEWVKVNVMAINEMGAEAWLKMLLDVLSGEYVTGDGGQNHLKKTKH